MDTKMSDNEKNDPDFEEEEAPFPLTELDKIGLKQKDEDFQLHTWDALKEIIGKLPLYSTAQIVLHIMTYIWSIS